MKTKKFTNFAIIWLGQFFSTLGSGISSFGLSVWILNTTGSATPFAISCLCSVIPGIIFAPFAGSLADRKGRKKIILIADSLDALLKVVMVLLLASNLMNIYIIYPIMFLSASFGTFQSPAFSASIPMLVEKENLSKANGMLQFSQAAQSMIAPVVAGALYGILKLQGLIIIDFITYMLGFTSIALVKIPDCIKDDELNTDKHVIYNDFKDSWKYLKRQSGIINLVLVFAVVNFIANLSMVLMGPMILVKYDSSAFGIIETICGTSMVIGGIVSSIIPDVKNKIRVIFLTLMVSGAGLFITGLRAEWIMIAAGIFVFYFLVPYANALFSTVIQTRIEPEMLGRCGSLVGALVRIVIPVSCIIAGPLADFIFEPLMASDGILKDSIIANIWGIGQGRGYGIMFSLCGIILIGICLIGYMKNSKNKETAV